jgi:hypothetical protein
VSGIFNLLKSIIASSNSCKTLYHTVGLWVERSIQEWSKEVRRWIGFVQAVCRRASTSAATQKRLADDSVFTDPLPGRFVVTSQSDLGHPVPFAKIFWFSPGPNHI